jgi:Holliday junction DNA helicase RuvA
VSALNNLGFKPAEAARAVALAQGDLGEDADANALIKLALKKVGR